MGIREVAMTGQEKQQLKAELMKEIIAELNVQNINGIGSNKGKVVQM